MFGCKIDSFLGYSLYHVDHLERYIVGLLKVKSNRQDIENIFLRTIYEYCTMIGGVSSCFSLVEFLDHMDVHS